ncbi:MAG: VWA domain-containing protein [Erysipelotrichaceae bacterium]|nr:VWA domain-containing protein [Erysipelotrichaceae bacterium]
MRKYLLILFAVFFSLFLCSCSSGFDDKLYPSHDDIPDNFVLGELVKEEETKLTCIAHDDNEYYESWVDLVYEYNGVFNYFNGFYPLKTNNRLTINAPVGADIEISLLDNDGNVVYTNVPNAQGICYLFPNWFSYMYKIRVKYYNDFNNEPIITEYEMHDTITLSFGVRKVEKDTIDLMFVVDTTTSMDDELEFLKNEISDVVEEVNSFNDCIVNVAVLLYKDKGEIYETLYSEFTEDINAQLEFLENKIAYGGGDFEEAVEVAIEEAASKSWSGSNSTKIIVHIGDAPAHDENINDWYNAVIDLCNKGIRLITVASSGINKKTEYLFRSMTLISNGTYVAITNHSGIGNDHIDSSVDVNVTVEYLDRCLVRLITGYHTGILYDPIPIN